MTVAHYFTFLRLVLIPLFLIVYLHPGFIGLKVVSTPWVLAFIMALSELTDACDGYLARRLNQVTDLGKILDPMADSLSRLGVFFCFSQGVVSLPLEIPLLMLYRDVAVSTLRTICALKGFALAARWSGKLKAGVQAFSAFAILALMALYENEGIERAHFELGCTLLGSIACGFSLYSGFEYFAANKHYLKPLLKQK